MHSQHMHGETNTGWRVRQEDWTNRTRDDSFQQHALHRFSFNPGSQTEPHIERMHKYIDNGL